MRRDALVRFEGELDAYVAPDVRRRLDEASAGDGPGRLLVADLERVTFLDSTVLGVLVGTLRRLRASGGNLVLVYPSGPARRIFELTGLDDVFEARAPTSATDDGF